MYAPFSFTTDTAALSVFDLQAIRHRLEDTPDWWTIEQDELQESNNGNILLLHLETDGTYDVHIVQELAQPQISCLLYVPSGKLFIGAAEDTTGGDLEPDDSEAVSGQLYTMQPGIYILEAARQQHTIQLTLRWLTAHVNDLPQQSAQAEPVSTDTADSQQQAATIHSNDRIQHHSSTTSSDCVHPFVNMAEHDAKRSPEHPVSSDFIQPSVTIDTMNSPNTIQLNQLEQRLRL